MRLSRMLILVLFLIPGSARPVLAQGRNEIAFSAGGGPLLVNPGGGATPVFSFSYQFHITGHFSVEAALDVFYYKFVVGPPDSPSLYRDDYAGVEAAVVYNFRAHPKTGRWLPFVAAGIGKTTTDFTEVPSQRYYRLGGGVAYHLTERLGIRLEARDEIIRRLWANGNPHGNLPSLRCGIVFRF